MSHFELKQERRLEGFCEDERITNWCLQYLTDLSNTGELKGKFGFGCPCDNNQRLDEKYRIGLRTIDAATDEWKNWMADFNYNQLTVYFCTDCGSWIIEDDF
jgi:hypothetical protein